MHASRCALLVIDIQEKLLPTMADPDRVVAKSTMLMTAAARLDVPVLVSEQYPKGLGPTVKPLAELEGAREICEKMTFSCVGDAGWAAELESIGRRQVVVCGIEAHVCVLQTAIDLLERGFDVHVVADAVDSRFAENHRLALERMRDSGAEIVTTEMVLFEWLERAGTPEFKDVSKLVK